VHGEKKILRLACTKGNEQDFSRQVEFRFKIGDEEHVLQACPGNPEKEVLFAPFRDTMSCLEISGRGRYLDLVVGKYLMIDRTWILDSNKDHNLWYTYC
jgi:uncharacterized protein (DUF1684 family)